LEEATIVKSTVKEI